MIKIIPAIVFGLVFICSSNAQFTRLDGGRTNFQMNNNFLLQGSSVESARSGVSASYGGVAALFGNPAGLTAYKGFFVQTDVILPWLQAKVTSEGFLKDPFHQAFDEAVDGMDDPPDEGDRAYPEFETKYGYKGGPVGGGLFYHTTVNGMSLVGAAGFSVMTDFSMDLSMDDVVTKIAYPFDDTDEGSDSLRAYFEMAIQNRFRLSLVQQSLGAGLEIPMRLPLKFGVGLHRFSAQYLAELYLTGDFLATRNGLVYEFNSPDADWTDSLYMDYFGVGVGYGYGTSFGVSWELLPWLHLDAMVDYNGDIPLEGDVTGVAYKLYAMDFLGDEAFNTGDINASKISLTQYNSHYVDNIHIRTASKAGAALSFLWKQHNRINLSYAYNYRNPELKFDYRYSRTFLDEDTKEVVQNSAGEDSLKVRESYIKFSPDYTHFIHFGLEINRIHFQFGAQFWNGLKMNLGNRVKTVGADVPVVPSFGIGYGFVLGPRMEVNFSGMAIPEPLFKTSLRYNL
jgi:hypothetical protein